jgi:hypothetical protein
LGGVPVKQIEEDNEIIVAVIDETYDQGEDTYEADSLKYLNSLEEEFGEKFEDSNVGPGADIPAFLTTLRENILPLMPWLLAIFFSGKPIIDNNDAWWKIYSAISRYFSKPLVLSRNGAAVLAINAAMSEIGGTPKLIRLKSYRPAGIWDVDDFEKLAGFDQIASSPQIVQLGMVFHLFEIETDTMNFLIGVNGKEVLIRRV